VSNLGQKPYKKPIAKDVVAFLAVALLAAAIWNLDPQKEIKEQVKVLPPPAGLEKLHFGFQDAVADVLWLDFIQHAYDCSKYKDPNGKHCPERWGFQTLKTASLLAPRLKVLYEYGAVQLSVLLDDHRGAAQLFDRGLKEFSGDWAMHYRAAFLYIEEIKNTAKAADLMLKASNLGAPYWTKSLASRLFDQSGQIELSLRVLEELHQNTKAGPWKDELASRIGELAQKYRNLSL